MANYHKSSYNKSQLTMELVTKSGILYKRSIYKKNKLGAQNYKSRVFELTGFHLNYYAGELQVNLMFNISVCI